MRSEATLRRILSSLHPGNPKQETRVYQNRQDCRTFGGLQNDNEVLRDCTQFISEYNRRLNLQDTSLWSVKEVISFLQTQESDASFTDYARLHINRMINSDHDRNAKNYKMAVQSLERYLGTNQIMFSHLSSTVLRSWIKSLMTKARCKEMYPVCVRQIFKAAILDQSRQSRAKGNQCRGLPRVLQPPIAQVKDAFTSARVRT